MSGSSNLDSKDRKFVMEAAQGGMLEVEAGRLAQTSAQDPQVKQLASTIVNDHQAANDKLKSIAQSKGMTLPTSLDHEHQAKLDKLKKAQGSDFDKQFVQMMEEDHHKDIKKFQTAARDAKDSDVKSFASTTLPTLQQHSGTVTTVASAIGVSGKSSRSASAEGAPSSSGSSRGSSTMGSGSTSKDSTPSSGSTTSGGSTNSSGSTTSGGSSSSSDSGR